MSDATTDTRAEPPAAAEPPTGAHPELELGEDNVRALRLGHGANCSSVGSVIDTLFIGATIGGALFAAVCAAMKNESVTVVGTASPAPPAERDATPRDAVEHEP